MLRPGPPDRTGGEAVNLFLGLCALAIILVLLANFAGPTVL